MSTLAVPLETPTVQSRRAVPWVAIVSLATLVVAHVPMLYRYLRGLYDLPHYQFIVMLPIGAAVLAWPRIRRLGEMNPGKAEVFTAWLAGAIGLLSISVVLDSPWFGAVSIFCAVAAVAHAVGGRRLVYALAPALVLLLFGVRLPMQADEWLTQQLQHLAAVRASAVMNYINEAHILDGNVVETPVKRYMVEEACSGVQSLFVLTACAVFFGLWMRETWGRIIMLVLATWWWAWVMNVVRVLCITVFNSRWGVPIDVSDGWPHEALGIVLFMFTLGLIVSSEHLLLFFIPRGVFSGQEKLNNEAKPIADYGPTHAPDLGRTRLATPLVAVVYSGLIVLQLLPQLNKPEATATAATLNTLQAGIAPKTFGEWTLLPDLPDDEATKDRDGFYIEKRREDSQWGAHSQTWRYVKGSKQFVVSVDYFFRGWHELTICYRTAGWDMEHRSVVDVPREGAAAAIVAPNEKCVEAVLHRPEEGNYSLLLFTSFNGQQKALPVHEKLSMYFRLVDRWKGFVERIKSLGAAGTDQDDQVQSFQLQVFIQSADKPTDSDRKEALAMFSEFRTRLGTYLADQTAGGAQ